MISAGALELHLRGGQPPDRRCRLHRHQHVDRPGRLGNVITNFNASANNVAITANSPLTGTMSGLNTPANVLNQSGDSTSGVANLTTLGMTYTGTTGTGTFTATSGTKTGTSGNVTINAGALDHFTFNAASPQTDGVAFTGTNTLTAQDIGNNTITNFNAASNNVTITPVSPLTGTVSGLHGSNVLNQAADFSSGVANLTSLGMTYTATPPPGRRSDLGARREARQRAINVAPSTTSSSPWPARRLTAPPSPGSAR